MKGKHLLLHHCRRTFAIAAVALATAGAAHAQNLITPETKATQGFAAQDAAIDWTYQTFQAAIDLSGNTSEFNIINIGTQGDCKQNDSGGWWATNTDGEILHFYFKNGKLTAYFCTNSTQKAGYEDSNYNLSSHGNILYITLSSEGLTLTDGNGTTVKTFDKETVDLILAKSTIEISANSGSSNPSTALYKYARVKGVTMANAADTKGMYAIKGWTDEASDVTSLVTDATKTAYDLTGLKSPFAISPANKNAIVAVAGTIGTDGTATPTDSWGDTKNLVVADGDNLAAVNTINLIDDSNYYPVYTGHAITTTEKSGGYTYTREVKISTTYGYKWISFCLPMDLTTIPDGVTVWAYNANKSTYGNLVFNNTTHPKAHTPYFAQATKDVTISASAIGTLDMTSAQSISNNKETPIVFHGNYGVIAGDGTQYALYYSSSTGTKLPTFYKFLSGSTIDAFRAYLTKGNNASDADDLSTYTLSFDGDATAIRNISTENAADADIYTIDGRRTGSTSLQTLPHGLYIQGGKKVVVK